MSTLTTLAFVIGGVVIWIGAGSRWVAVTMVFTGIGSLLFHGPMPSYAQAAHDVTLWALVAVIVVTLANDLIQGTRWRPYLGPGLLLATVAIVGRLGSTDGPLCVPESVWQPHGLWHVGAATAITWWALQRRG